MRSPRALEPSAVRVTLGNSDRKSTTEQRMSLSAKEAPLLRVQPVSVVEHPGRANTAGRRGRRGCACCDLCQLLPRIVFGGVWLGNRNAPQALPQRCYSGCWPRRSPFTCCVQQRFQLVDGELHLHLKACDHYQTYLGSHQPGAAAGFAPRYRFEMRLRTDRLVASSRGRGSSRGGGRCRV